MITSVTPKVGGGCVIPIPGMAGSPVIHVSYYNLRKDDTATYVCPKHTP